MKCFLGLILLLCPAFGQTCAPSERLRPSDSVAGVIGESNCLLPDGTPYAGYSLVLPTRGRIQLNVDSGSFDAALILRDSQGRKLDTGAGVDRALERGAYTVVVNAGEPGQGGDFTLRSSFTPEPGTLCRDFAPIGPNQTVTANLTASSCLLPDGSPYDGYFVSPFGTGTLQVSMQSDQFDTSLLVRDSEGHALAADRASVSLPAGGDETYTVVAAATPGAEGPYRISVQFQPADGDPCQLSKSFSSPGEDQGTISPQGCGLTFPGGDTPSPFNYYALQVAENGVAELRLSSAAFDPRLRLLDESGEVIDDDLLGGGPGLSIIRRQLRPGNYTVEAFSTGPDGGDYTLSYNFLPPETCPTLSLDGGTTIPGMLSGTGGCRTADGISDVYPVVMAAGGTLDITMSSGDFDPLLVLRDGKGNRIVADRNDDGDDTAHITADLPAGKYSIVAATNDVTGGYSIGYQITPHDPVPCATVTKMDPNSGYLGLLGSTSCHGSDGQPVDYYEFTTPADGTVLVVMTSSDVDSYLTVEDAAGSVLRQDDNSYGERDAMTAQFLPAGTYRIGARAANSSPGGYYRLYLYYSNGDRPAGCAPLRELAPGDSVEAQLSYTSCLYPDDTFADLYRLNIAETTPLQATLSAAFDANLLLLDAKGNLVEEGETGFAVNLEPGNYYLVAKGFEDYASIGAYTLSVSSLP
ncbi:MAG: PPC domain-containing protein [Acidobacteria bacterium]|nr:PPC domain-containing protein [Acidobacteriota bacterium]